MESNCHYSLKLAMYFTSISTKYLLQKKNPIKKCFFLMVVEIHSFFFYKTSFLGVVSYTKISVKSMILVPVTDAKTSERTARGNAIAENKITNC